MRDRSSRKWRKFVLVVFVVSMLAAALFYLTCSIFVIQPIGAVPRGVTLVMTRIPNIQFVDSADAWCERNIDGVNLLCRGAMLARIGVEAEIILKLPYSEWLYLYSTGGVVYMSGELSTE